jgi:hypothetical protein
MALAASLAFADLYGAGSASLATTAVSPLAGEPLYADIISRAQGLEAAIDGFRATPGLKASATPVSMAGFPGFKTRIAELSALDMKGHLDLAARQSDGDLKCILKGISQDLPKKLSAVELAKTGAEEDAALDELRYLLADNVGVITAPPKPPV